MKNEFGLTQQQEAFACAIVEGLSQSDAYRRAYRTANMTTKQVHEEACKLAVHRKVTQRVSSLQARVADAAILKAADILLETRNIALSSVAGLMGVRGGKLIVLMPNELDAATRSAVRSFKIDDLGRIEYHFWDKNAALERAAKILGLFKVENAQRADALGALLAGLQGNVVMPGMGSGDGGGQADVDLHDT